MGARSIETMTEWELKLFGDFHLSSRERGEITSLGRRDRAVLAYLALAPKQRESRERLATLLWSNRGDEQARHSLAQSTAVVRKALGDVDKTMILSEPASLAVDSANFEIDVLVFRDLIDAGTRDSLKQALALYRDDLLPGFEVRSEGFDDWVYGERERLRNLAIEALQSLTLLEAEENDWNAVIETANRTLAMDNLREYTHRLLMRAYAKTGQRALALQQFNSLVEILERDLQVGPEPETEALIEDIKAGRISTNQARTINIENVEPEEQPDTALPADTSHPAHHVSGQLYYWVVGGLFTALLAITIAVTAIFWRVPELAPDPIGYYVRLVKTELQPDPLSIAILPFEGHGESDAADFAEALGGGMTTALSISSEMRVISRSDVRQFDEFEITTRGVAKKLKVRYLLEGSVRKSGDQIAIDIGLIDTQKGRHRIWSETYRRHVEDFIQFQQDVTFDVIRSLAVRLTEGEQERINRMGGTQILEAWLAASRGEKHLRLLTPHDNLIARASYERALALDSNYTGAMEGLAWTYFVSARFGWTTLRLESALKAKEIGEQILVLDPNRPQTFSLLGSLSLLAGDFSNAVSLGEKAFSLDPNDSDVAALLSYTLTYTGEPLRAISLIDRAVDLKPVSPQWYYWLRGRAHRLTGQYDEAIEILAKIARDGPTSPIPLVELASAYSESGKMHLAQQTAKEIMRLSPGFTVGDWTTMSPYRDKEDLNKEVKALRAAGLPD
jgi:DNA-binding SARP family transcriptional activator/TolB-like protein/Flp pilus assembly protein TadD